MAVPVPTEECIAVFGSAVGPEWAVSPDKTKDMGSRHAVNRPENIKAVPFFIFSPLEVH